MSHFPISVGNIWPIFSIFKKKSATLPATRSTGSSSCLPTLRDTRDSNMSAPQHSDEVLPPAQSPRSEVIHVRDDEDGSDNSPAPQDSSRHAPSKQINPPRPPTSSRQRTNRDLSCPRQTRSRSQAAKVTAGRFDDVDDQGKAHPDDVPGSKVGKRTQVHSALTLAPTGTTSASFEILDNSAGPLLRSHTLPSVSQGSTSSRRQTLGAPSRGSSQQCDRPPGRTRRTSEYHSVASTPPSHLEIRQKDQSHDVIEHGDKDASLSPPKKRLRKRSSETPLKRPSPVESDMRSFHTPDSMYNYNPEDVQYNRARRERRPLVNDNDRPVRDMGVPSISYARNDMTRSPDAVRAATAAAALESQQILRRSRRVKNPSLIAKEQREVAEELVELDAFTVNKPYDGPTYVIFVFPPGKRGSITVTQEERERLKKRLYLNDSLIDFYIKYLQRCLQAQARSPENIPFFYSSFFFKRMIQKKPIDYNGVKSWTKDIDIFRRKYIFVPICDSYHWSLIIIINLHTFEDLMENGSDSMDADKKPKIIYMDSLDPERGSEFATKIIYYLSEEYYNRKARDDEFASEPLSQRSKKISKLVKVLKPRVPIQSNEYDCGLYLLQCLKLFVSDGYFQQKVIGEENDLEASFSHTEIEQLRKDICDLMDRLQRNWDRRITESVKCNTTNMAARDSETNQDGSGEAESVENVLSNFLTTGSGVEMDEKKNVRHSVFNESDPIDITETREADVILDVKSDLNGTKYVNPTRVNEESKTDTIERVVVLSDDPVPFTSSYAGVTSSDQSSKADRSPKDFQVHFEQNTETTVNVERRGNIADDVVDLSDESVSEKAEDVKSLEENVDIAETTNNVDSQAQIIVQHTNSRSAGDNKEDINDGVLLIEKGSRSRECGEELNPVVSESDGEIAGKSHLSQERSSETMDLVECRDLESMAENSMVIDGPFSDTAGPENGGMDDGSEPGSQEIRGMHDGKSLGVENSSLRDRYVTIDRTNDPDQSDTGGVEIVEEFHDEREPGPLQIRKARPPDLSVKKRNMTDVIPDTFCNNAHIGDTGSVYSEVQVGTTSKYGGKRRRNQNKMDIKAAEGGETIPEEHVEENEDVITLGAETTDRSE